MAVNMVVILSIHTFILFLLLLMLSTNLLLNETIVLVALGTADWPVINASNFIAYEANLILGYIL